MADGWTFDDDIDNKKVATKPQLRQLTPEEMAIVKGGKMGPLGETPVASQRQRSVGDYFSDAYDRATSLSGEGEIGALSRAMEDLFNLNDAYDQATKGGTVEQREIDRDASRVAKVRGQRELWKALDEADPAWRENGSLLGNVARFSSGLLGDTAGNANPTYLIGGGSNAATRIGTQALANAGIDTLLQGNEIREGIQDNFDAGRTAMQALAGAIIQSGGEGASALWRKLFPSDVKTAGGPDIDVEEKTPETPDEWRNNYEKVVEENARIQSETGEEAGNFQDIRKAYEDYGKEHFPNESLDDIVVDGQPINYRTPEEEDIVQGAIKEVSEGWGVSPDRLGEDPAMVNRVQNAIQKRGGDNSLLNKEMAPEIEAVEAHAPAIEESATIAADTGDTRPVSERMTEALKEASVLNEEQRKLYTKQRQERLKEVLQARNVTDGEAGYRSEANALKGAFDKVDFEGVRDKFTPEEVDSLFDEVKNSDAFGRSLYDPITARAGLAKLLDGQVPTAGELNKLNKVFGPEFVKAATKHMSKGKKMGNLVREAINLPRSLMASMDLSAPLRQGIFLVNSKEFWKAWPDMFKAFGSERAYKGIMDDIQGRETYPLMEQSKLAVTDVGGALTNKEEDFLSTWATKVPGVGKVVKASERAYSGFLNKLRADTFDSIANDYAKAGVDLSEDPKALVDMAYYINSATGRGNLPKSIEKHAELLNGIFFSPRLIASRVNLLNPATYVKLDPVVRKRAVKDLIGFGSTASAVLSLATMAGLDVETDPRSSDFGKIKDGDTRYDVLGGFGQYVTLAARLAANETKTLKGDIRTLGEGYKADTRKDVLEKFLTNKFAPVPGYIRDFLDGRDPVGNEFDVTRDTAELFVPLLLQDLAKMYETDGVEGVLKGVPAIFGVGAQTYGDRRTSKDEETTPQEEDTSSEPTGWTYED